MSRVTRGRMESITFISVALTWFPILFGSPSPYTETRCCVSPQGCQQVLHSDSTEELISAGRLLLMPLCFDLSLLHTIKGLFSFRCDSFKLLLLYPIYDLHRELCYDSQWPTCVTYLCDLAMQALPSRTHRIRSEVLPSTYTSSVFFCI